MNLKERIELIEADSVTLNYMASEHHYMLRPLHDRAIPFGWRVVFDGMHRLDSDNLPAGFIMFAAIHYTRLRGEFGYEGLPTKWQVLSLARLWLHDDLPHNSETVVIAKALKLVQARWLQVHPPRFLDQPYHIVKVISYADKTYGHEGTIYKASNFRLRGEVVSKQRHDSTRGSGMNGNTLACFIKDLRPPRWEWNQGVGLPLFDSAAAD